MFMLYKQKLNPMCEALWQQPRRGKINYNDEYWYENKRMGHNPLDMYYEAFMWRG